LEYILEPIIDKMRLIENRIKISGKFLVLVLPYVKLKVNILIVGGNDTILSFEEEMYMHFQIISYVYSVHSKAIISNWETTDYWKTSIKYV